MCIGRSNLVHRFVALAAGLGFAALTLGIIIRLHLAEHPGDHDSGHCSTCLALSGQVKEVDPGTTVLAQPGQAISEPIWVTPETPVLTSSSFRLNARSPPLSFPV